MWIVKIGGSLAGDPSLREWLRLLASPHGRAVIIVPGGGAFADSVRDQQTRWGFADAPAHAMAVLAMAQFGLVLQALCPALPTETTLAGLRARRTGAGAVVWLPLELVHETQGIEASWRVTSDSLAAWLARDLDADRLVLVKSCALPPGRNLDELARAGVVDPAFPAFVQDAPFAIDLLEKQDFAGLRALLGEIREVARG